MAIKSNIDEIIAKLERIKAALNDPAGPPPVIVDAMASAINSGMGKMKHRIFNQGQDAEGNSLGNYHGNKTRLTKGKYSIASDDEDDERDRKKAKRNLNRARKSDPDGTYTEYEKFRLGEGRQIDHKDLEVKGSLRRSIDIVKEDGKVVVAITNSETAKIAKYQEQQIGNIRAGQNAKTGSADPAKIFAFSQPEYEHVKKEGNAAIGQALKKLFDEA